VRTEIVHDHHVAKAQFRAQDLIKIGEEYLPIRGRLNGHGGDHAACADGTNNGEDFPSAIGRSFMNARASGGTGVQACHLCRNTAFIEKD